MTSNLTVRSAIANRGSRAGHAAAVFSVLALVAVVPHLVDGTGTGTFEDVGIDPVATGYIAGGLLALQISFAFAALRERRVAYGGILVLGLAWAAVAAVGHGEAFLPGEFGDGLASRAAVWGTVVLQGLAALSALSALRSTRRTSFSGTGSFS